MRPFPEKCNRFGQRASRALEMAGAAGDTALSIPLVKTMVGDHPIQHGAHLLIGLFHKAISDQLLNHASTEPGPVTSILIDIRILHASSEQTYWVGRIERKADAGHPGKAHVLHHLPINHRNLFRRE